MNLEKLKNTTKNIGLITVIAFLCGAALAIGQKTVDSIWPDCPVEIMHDYRITPAIPIYDEIPEDNEEGDL